MTLIPLIPFALNHSPRTERGNLAPITIFRGLPHTSALDALLAPLSDGKFLDKPVPASKIIEMTIDLQKKIDEMHKSVLAQTSKRRERVRSRRMKIAEPVNFGQGDFVLVARPTAVFPDKLSVQWTGPYVVTEVVNDWIFRVRHLSSLSDVNSGKVDSMLVHSQRLRFYADSELELSESIIKAAEADLNGKYDIEKLLDIRPSTTSYDILVKWLGFSEDENSWEPIERLLEDVPVYLKEFLFSKEETKSIWNNLME